MTSSDNFITIPYASNILASTGLSPDELTSLAKLAVAAKLFSDGRLTLGEGAEFCGLGKVEFMEKLYRNGFSAVNLRVEDTDDELNFAHGR